MTTTHSRADALTDAQFEAILDIADDNFGKYPSLSAVRRDFARDLRKLLAVSPASQPACRACDAGLCSVHGPEQRMAGVKVSESQPAAAPIDEREYAERATKWRESFDAMHRRAMNAEQRVRELESPRTAPSPADERAAFDVPECNGSHDEGQIAAGDKECTACAGEEALPVLLTAQDLLMAIDTFEIVGENNDSREPNAEDRFILTEFIAHASRGFTVEPRQLCYQCNGCGDNDAAPGWCVRCNGAGIEPDDQARVASANEPGAEGVAHAPAGYGLTAEQLATLQSNGLKPEEIGGDASTQHDRVRELVHWFARFARGEANPKWAYAHAFELAYFIASNGPNRHIDLSAIANKAYLEGVNISASDRGILERLGKIAPQPAQADARQTDDEWWNQALRERDIYEEYADEMASAIANHLHIEIGEHSNFNNPWLKALEAIKNARQADARGGLTADMRESVDHAATWLDRSEDLQNKAHAERLRALLAAHPVSGD